MPPTPVTMFFSTAPKAAAVLLSTRLCLDALAPATDAWRQIVIFAALASIFLGAVAAYGQTNIKRLLAYSSINNVGFALVGLAAAGPQGASSVLFYMAVYVVMNVGAFLCVLWMRDKDGQPVESIDSLSGLAQTRPSLAAAFAISASRPACPTSCSTSAAIWWWASSHGTSSSGGFSTWASTARFRPARGSRRRLRRSPPISPRGMRRDARR